MKSNYPPPTQGLSCDELVRLQDIANSFLEHLKNEIPVKCEEEGHQYNYSYQYSYSYKIVLNDKKQIRCKRCGQVTECKSELDRMIEL